MEHTEQIPEIVPDGETGDKGDAGEETPCMEPQEESSQPSAPPRPIWAVVSRRFASPGGQTRARRQSTSSRCKTKTPPPPQVVPSPNRHQYTATHRRHIAWRRPLTAILSQLTVSHRPHTVHGRPWPTSGPKNCEKMKVLEVLMANRWKSGSKLVVMAMSPVSALILYWVRLPIELLAGREVLPRTCCANVATGVPFIVEKECRPYSLWLKQSENGTNCSTV